MAHLFIRHQTKDYTVWKATFDGLAEIRRAGGEKTCRIFHPYDDPNNLVLFFEWDNLANARAFMANPDLKETIGEGGVSETSEAYFLEEYEQGDV